MANTSSIIYKGWTAMLSLKLADDELQQLWQEKLRESLKYRMDQVNFLLVSFYGIECFGRFRD